MLSVWNDKNAQDFVDAAVAAGQPEALGLRIYTSRLIGQNPDLVLHGGGNTSVKIPNAEGGAIIHVKGSGWDLGDIEAPGLPAMWLEPLLTTREIPHMSDEDMVAFLRKNLLDPAAPNPSIEALLHAYMPHAFVDHTHATATLALADQTDMQDVVTEIYGDRVGFVPYVMPGYSLSHACNDALLRNPNVDGLWLEQHGLFTFAETAKASYELMIEFVTLAEAYLAARDILIPAPEANDAQAPAELSTALQAALGAQGDLGAAPSLDFRTSPSIRRYLARENIAKLSQRGTATPDHVIRIKPFAMVLSATDGAAEIEDALGDFALRYRAYFDRNAANAAEEKVMLDPLPRSILVRGVGLFGVGATPAAAKIAGDLLEQTSRIVNGAEDYKRFTPISEADLFDMEYWSLEQAKLKK
jgi:rhamnose utilization protein RhaD (predicted bifunctional aldolase and dehydrogenase)